MLAAQHYGVQWLLLYPIRASKLYCQDENCGILWLLSPMQGDKRRRLTIGAIESYGRKLTC